MYVVVYIMPMYLFVSACFPNGTIAFENPNPILFTHAMAVQYEGVASAFNCNCTLIGNWAFISGCNTVRSIFVLLYGKIIHELQRVDYLP